MFSKNYALSEDLRTRLIEILNRRLADAIDLQLQCRQAYWNIKGANFLSLRKLFDQVTEEVEGYTNLIAGRIVQIGGKAEGTVHTVSGRSSLDKRGFQSAGHSDALASTLTDFARHTRYASMQATELKDADTTALFNEIARGTDKWLWFVETSQQPDN